MGSLRPKPATLAGTGRQASSAQEEPGRAPSLICLALAGCVCCTFVCPVCLVVDQINDTSSSSSCRSINPTPSILETRKTKRSDRYAWGHYLVCYLVGSASAVDPIVLVPGCGAACSKLQWLLLSLQRQQSQQRQQEQQQRQMEELAVKWESLTSLQAGRRQQRSLHPSLHPSKLARKGWGIRRGQFP